jgi:hypothetical protein
MHAIEGRREALTAEMMRVIDRTGLDTPRRDQEQFVAGFVDLAIHAAKGEQGPRDEYLAVVVPAVRQSKMPLGVVMAGMVSVAMGGALALEGEERNWWIRFTADYTRDFCARWESA